MSGDLIRGYRSWTSGNDGTRVSAARSNWLHPNTKATRDEPEVNTPSPALAYILVSVLNNVRFIWIDLIGNQDVDAASAINFA